MDGSVEEELRAKVERVLVRNGGAARDFKWERGLLDPSLKLDSLDLAEVFAWIEKNYGCSPMERPVVPRSWREVAGLINANVQ